MKNLLAICAALAAGCGSAETKPEPILNEDVSPPEKGSYDKPADKIGKKGAPLWSPTTLDAAYAGRKPVDGKEITVVGEIIDISCYYQVGKHGIKHLACTKKCLEQGQPIGLLAKDGTVYILMEEEHDPRRDGQTDFRRWCIDRSAWIVEVTGTMTQVGATKSLYVHMVP